MSSSQPSRVIVIGAGWTGLAAAKTYLQLFPSVSLTIIDSDSSVGGVWSASRIYPGLIADSVAAIFDYSDFPMDEELGISKWADLPAEKVHEYLEKYVDRWGLRGGLRLRTTVLRAVHEGKGWRLEFETRTGGGKEAKRETMVCDKLIIATGTSSTPSLPDGIEWSKFDGTIIHSKDVGLKHQLLTSAIVKRVTVVGGNKSAVDVVNMCAMAGKEVDWVIRKEGFGPGVLFEARTHGIHAGAIKAARASAIPSPNVLVTSGFWYRFFHSGKNRFGSWLVKWMLAKLSKSAIKSLYEGNENTMKIAPDTKDIFWSNSGVSVVHDNNFMDMVRDGRFIHIHRASVRSFSKGKIHFSDGQIVPCDVAVFATGWQINQPTIFGPSLLPDLGLPFDLKNEDPETAKYWNTLDQASKSKLRPLFPMLANLPPEVVEYDLEHNRPVTTTPFRLFRGMVPPKLAARGDRSLIMLGLLINTNVPIYAEVSSLWGIAYLENLPFSPLTSYMLSDERAMNEDISLLEEWNVLRFRDKAAKYLDGSIEIQSFTDLLMKDMGLRSDRKKWAAERGGKRGIFGLRTWIKEWFTPYRGMDYRGMVEEYKTTWGLQGGLV